MKKYLYILMLTILVVVMSELQVAGMLPEIAADLEVTTGAVGALVSIYALGMAIGGPLIAFALRATPPKRALLTVVAAYAVLEILVPLIHEYWWVVLIRVLTGCLAGAAFGLSLTFAARLAPSPEKIGESVSITLSGIMVGTVLGLPLSHFIATQWNWQASFYVLGAAALLLFLISLATLPSPEAATAEASAQDLRNLRAPRLWSRYLVSLLTIGAAYAAFSYFTPLLEHTAGFASETTTLILFGYGLATFIGNLIVGKFADRHAIGVLRLGHTILVLSLAVLAIFAGSQPVAVVMVLLVGLAGVTMNPALVTRVVEVGRAGSLVTTVHTSVITFGVVIGTAVSAGAIDFVGDENPATAMWVGTTLAVLAALLLAMQASRSNKAIR